MTDPLLRTKLCMPPVRSELVRRDCLLDRLGAGLWRGDGGEVAFSTPCEACPCWDFGDSSFESFMNADAIMISTISHSDKGDSHQIRRSKCNRREGQIH